MRNCSLEYISATRMIIAMNIIIVLVTVLYTYCACVLGSVGQCDHTHPRAFVAMVTFELMFPCLNLITFDFSMRIRHYSYNENNVI